MHGLKDLNRIPHPDRADRERIEKIWQHLNGTNAPLHATDKEWDFFVRLLRIRPKDAA